MKQLTMDNCTPSTAPSAADADNDSRIGWGYLVTLILNCSTRPHQSVLNNSMLFLCVAQMQHKKLRISSSFIVAAKEHVLHYPREVDLDNHRRMHLGRGSAMGSDMVDSSDARDSGGYLCLDHHLFMGNRSRLQGLAGG